MTVWPHATGLSRLLTMRCATECDHQDDCKYGHNAKRCEEDAMFEETVSEKQRTEYMRALIQEARKREQEYLSDARVSPLLVLSI